MIYNKEIILCMLSPHFFNKNDMTTIGELTCFFKHIKDPHTEKTCKSSESKR
jgi:hypothetical protein